MDFYSLDEANYLITWYADKMIGTTVPVKATEESSAIKITHIDKEPYRFDQYNVIVFGKVYNQVFYTRQDIELIAHDLGLPLPKEVLKRR
jgi:hypothetical protein